MQFEPGFRMLNTSIRPAIDCRWKPIVGRVIRCILILACAVVSFPRFAAADLVSGRSDGSVIQVIAPLALTGPLSSTAKDYLIGAKAHIADFNGGASSKGRTVNLVAVDNPSTEQSRNVLSQALAESKSAMAVFMPMQIISALGVLNGEEMAIIAPPGRSFEEHDSSLSPNNFHIRGSWEIEFKKIAEHLGSINLNKVVFVYDNILGSSESSSLPLITQIFLRNKIGIKPIYLDGQAKNIDAAINEIKSYQPQAVILGLAGEGMSRFLDAHKSQIGPWSLYATSEGSLTSVRQALKKTGTPLAMTQAFPPYWDRTIPIVREYQDAMLKAGYAEFSYHSLEGFIAANVLTRALRNARAPLSRQSLFSAIENLGRVDLGGFIVDFSTRNHAGANYIDLIYLRPDGRYIR